MKNQSSLFKSFRFWLLAFVGIYLVFTVFIIPSVVKNQTMTFLNENLKHPSTLERVSFNPFGFEIKFYNFKIFDKKNEILIDFETIRVDFDLITTLFTQVVHFDSFTLYKPTVNVKLLKNGKLNLLSLIPENSNKKEMKENSSTKENKIFPINFDEIRIEQTEILFTDYTAPKPFKVTLFPLNYNFVNLSTQIQEKGTFDFDIIVNKHTKLQGQGALSLNPIHVNGDLSLSTLHTADFWSRVEDDYKFFINDAILDLNTKYKLDYAKDNLTLNLTNSNIKLEKFAMGSKENKKELISLKKFETSNATLSWPQQIVQIEKINLDKLYTDLVIHKNIRTNIAELFESKIQKDEKKASTQDSSKPWDIVISKFTLNDSKLEITDLSKKIAFKTNLNKIDYAFDDLSTKNNGIKKQTLQIQINNHTNINLNGNVQFEPLKLEGDLKVEDVQTNDFWSHVKDEVNFDLHDTRLDLSTLYMISIQKELDVILKNSNINIANLNLSSKKSKNSIISIKKMNTRINSFDLKKQDIKINDIQIHTLKTDFQLNKNKTNNIEPLFVSKTTAPSKSAKKTNSKEWGVDIKNIDLKNSKVSFKDKSINKTFSTSLNKINLNVKNINLKPKTKFTYKLKTKIDKKAKLTSKGKVSIKPLSVNSQYNLSNLHLNIFQPYLDETLNLDVKKANFNTKGKFKLQAKTNHITLLANSNIKKIDIKHKNSSESLIKVDKVNINKLVFNQSKNSLKIDSINLVKPYAKVHIDKNRVTNFSHISKSNADVQKNKKELLFDLGPIDIKKGSMNFTDLSLPLPFHSFIENLEGKVSELSSYSSKPSDIQLEGVIDTYGLAKIDGSLDYKNTEGNTKINMLFKNIATKNLTPYSSEFIGRKIDGGKLTLDLNYKIVESKLDATNNIIVHKIQLGSAIKSENSVNIPIDLAIALLEDSNGVIDLSLPIEGDINDPQFKIGSIVGQALTNLIIKIVTSPFSFLGSLLGIEGEELKYVEFESGSSSITPPAQEKLDLLIKAFKTRPNLSLEIDQTYHTKKDTHAIKVEKFDLKLNALLVELNKKNKEKDTYLMALESMYSKNKKAKPLEEVKKSYWTKETKKEKKVFEKTRYLNELKRSQINLTVVTKEELEQLASNRVKQIKDYLITKHSVEANRLIEKELVIQNSENKDKWIKTELGISVNKKR